MLNAFFFVCFKINTINQETENKMIQPISPYKNNQYKNINFKNTQSQPKTEAPPKWYEIQARGKTIETQRRNYSILIWGQFLAIFILGYAFFKGRGSKLFSPTTKISNFESLSDDAKIPTIQECKSINKNLKSILTRQINLNSADKSKIADFGEEKIGTTNRYLLYGPPGTGKSFFAKVYAKSIGAEYSEVLFSDLNGRWAGVTEGHMKNVFDSALKTAQKNPNKKYVLTLNEIDSLVASPDKFSDSIGSHAVSLLRQRSIFLNYMELLKEKVPNLTIIGTTNIVPKNNGLDRAAMSRFQNLIDVPYPEQDCLYEALKMNLSKSKGSSSIISDSDKELQELSEKMAKRKFSFRNLENVITEAKETYINDKLNGQDVKFGIEYLQKGEQNIKLSDGELEKKSKISLEDLKKIIDDNKKD